MNPKCALNLRSQRVLRRNNQLQKKRIGVGISRCIFDKALGGRWRSSTTMLGAMRTNRLMDELATRHHNHA
jgi:hypothetical protein